MRTTTTTTNRALGTLLVLAIAPGMAFAAGAPSTVAAEIEALIVSGNEYSREHLKGAPDLVSKNGSAEFWSSGGLLQSTSATDPLGEFESFSLHAKHIEVIELPGGQSAVAMYYSEGSFHPKGSAAVSNYLVRVSAVYVKEDGKWKVRAAHWSPILGGSGTSQTSVD